MRIGMVLYGYFPPDIRVEKEAKTLIELGHEVYLLSLGKGNMPEKDKVNNINIIRTPFSDKILNRKIKSILFRISFRDLLWERYIKDIIKTYKIHVIHVHDLPLLKTAVSVAKKLNIPVIADLHENYPEALKAWRSKNLKRKFIFSILDPAWRWKRLERDILYYADEVITVVDEAKEHYVNDCGIPPQKVTVIMNTEDLEVFNRLKLDELLIQKYRNNFVISYIGGFGPHRGLDTSIKAMPKIQREIPEAKLLLVGGRNPKYESHLKELCKHLGVENKVEFIGWVDFSLVPTYIALSDICLVPHHATGHTNTTIPHKLFQYMAMEKPVIVTDCTPLKRIIEECKCGVVIPSGDYNKMAEAIVMLYQNKEYARKSGKNGRRAVEEKYNWENEAKKLCELYERLEKGVKV